MSNPNRTRAIARDMDDEERSAEAMSAYARRYPDIGRLCVACGAAPDEPCLGYSGEALVRQHSHRRADVVIEGTSEYAWVVAALATTGALYRPPDPCDSRCRGWDLFSVNDTSDGPLDLQRCNDCNAFATDAAALPEAVRAGLVVSYEEPHLVLGITAAAYVRVAEHFARARVRWGPKGRMQGTEECSLGEFVALNPARLAPQAAALEIGKVVLTDDGVLIVRRVL